MTTATTTANNVNTTESPTIAATKAIHRAKRAPSTPTHKKTRVEQLLEQHTTIQQQLMAEAGTPSWRRILVSQLSGLFTGGAVYYVGLTLTDAAIVAATTLTASTFVAFMIAFIGICVSFICMLGAYAYTVNIVDNFDYAATKQRVSAAATKATSTVRSWFARKELGHA